MYVGSEVEDISDISESFRSAVIAKTFSNFKVMPNLLYYSKEQKNPSGIVVSHKKSRICCGVWKRMTRKGSRIMLQRSMRR